MNEFINDLEFNTSRQGLDVTLRVQNKICSSDECKVVVTQQGIKTSFLTATQLVIFLILVFCILFVTLIYCKTCNRKCAMYSQHSAYESERNQDVQSNESIDSLHYNAIHELRDRPPPYNEACSAPPLYTSPFNRVSMLETPPVYPETPQLSDRKSSIDEALPIINHI